VYAVNGNRQATTLYRNCAFRGEMQAMAGP
jgi:hypothetical protein